MYAKQMGPAGAYGPGPGPGGDAGQDARGMAGGGYGQVCLQMVGC
jgi:hypothetical protein